MLKNKSILVTGGVGYIGSGLLRELPDEGCHFTCVDNLMFGDTKEKFTKQMLVNEIKKVLPDSKIEYIKKDDDLRDYRVNCDKIKMSLVLN